jgi:hypothetical protein
MCQVIFLEAVDKKKTLEASTKSLRKIFLGKATENP